MKMKEPRVLQRTLHSTGISVQVNTSGAELVSLKNADGLEYIWQAGEKWPRYTPLMFPVIGRTVDDTILHNGCEYPMTQHGFARDHEFDILEATDSTLKLQLRENSETLSLYPFPFQLTTTFRAEGSSVHVTHDFINTGTTAMPASLGWHPAFIWPGHQHTAASLQFECDEGPTIRRLDPLKVLLLPDIAVSPVQNRTLTLHEDTFSHGALCFLNLNSRSVVFTSEGGLKLTLSFPEFQHLTVWKAAGADMLCLEPWYGTPSPQDFRGELVDKPHQFHLAPGMQRSFSYSVTVD